MRSGAARADPDSCPPHNDLNRFTQGRQRTEIKIDDAEKAEAMYISWRRRESIHWLELEQPSR
jgi:hypothetical protein